MGSLTYKDIIDEKIAEWQNGLKKMQEQAKKAPADSQAELNKQMRKLREAIENATAQLHSLDEQETVENTMATKDKILKIFHSIDKDFVGHEDKTPFML